MATNTAVAEVKPANGGLMAKFASKYSVDPGKMATTLKQTVFKGTRDRQTTNEELLALLVVADQYGLNPFTKEIYAFPDKQNGIVPVVGVDGWTRIINEHPQYSGISFTFSESTVPYNGKDVPAWCECMIWRKDRERPTVVREWFDELVRNTGPWGSHPRRMLRHKALIQCARVAFGFAGIYDEDEAERIVDGGTLTANDDGVYEAPTPKGASKLDAFADDEPGEAVDHDPDTGEVHDDGPPPMDDVPPPGDEDGGFDFGADR